MKLDDDAYVRVAELLELVVRKGAEGAKSGQPLIL